MLKLGKKDALRYKSQTWCSSIVVEIFKEDCVGINNVEISTYEMSSL